MSYHLFPNHPSPRSILKLMLVLVGFLLITACTESRPTPNTSGALVGKRIAILVEEGFEQPELLKPRAALAEAGAETVIVSPHTGMLRAWNHDQWGVYVTVDSALSSVRPADFDGLLLPGGVINPDKLRLDPQAIEFVRTFVASGRPVASICHGPWMLVEANVVRGRRVTSWPSLRTDLVNAGAQWTDEPVVIDNHLVTSRKPEDIPQFNAAFIRMLSQP
jgi:protease I